MIIDGERIKQVPEGEDSPRARTHGIRDIHQSTELGDALKQLNEDSLDGYTKMSGIDMRANLHFAEIPSLLLIDTLVSFNFLPKQCLTFSRQKKRLSVSKNGEGRKDIVSISTGERNREVDKGSGIGRLFNSFRKQEYVNGVQQ